MAPKKRTAATEKLQQTAQDRHRRIESERDYEPGLGCIGVGCKAAFYTPADRAAHIKQAHPGEYQGPTADMQFVMDRIKDIHHDRRED